MAKKVEIAKTDEYHNNIKDKILFWLFKHFERILHKDKYGVNIWWQYWKFDKQAADYLKREYPTTSRWESKITQFEFNNKLNNIDNLVWGASKPVITINDENKRQANFTLILWQDNEVISSSNFVFVEE